MRDAINASGETPMPQLSDLFARESEPLSTEEFWNLCQRRDEYVRNYHKYWKSTSKLTRSGRNVDGVILPVAAHAAAPEGLFKHYGASIH